MLSPFDIIKGFLTLKSYFPWFCFSIILFGVYFFIKRKMKPNTTNWKGNTLAFLIIIGVLSLIFLFCFKQPKTSPSSQYYEKLIEKFDETIDKHKGILNDYQDLKTGWEIELKKTEDELQALYQHQKLTQEQKQKVKELLGQTENKITELKAKKQSTQENIAALKAEEKRKQDELDVKNGLITQKELELKNAMADDKKRLQEELDVLCKERITIVRELEQIRIKIGKLEIKKRMYSEMLENANTIKENLKQQFAFLTKEEQGVLEKIGYKEKRRNEIQTEINNINTKMKGIVDKIADLEIQLKAAEAAKLACDDWDKKHEFSFGNLRDAVFKGVEMYTDLFGGRAAMKALGNDLTKKVAGQITKVGLAINETHRAINLVKGLFENPDGTPKMMSQETYESIKKRIETDITKLEQGYKDDEKKLEGYKESLKDENLNKEEKAVLSSKEEVALKQNDILKNFSKITAELEEQQEEVSRVGDLNFEKEDLELKTNNLNEQIESIRAELKQANPNYINFTKTLRQKRYAKFNETLNAQTSKTTKKGKKK